MQRGDDEMKDDAVSETGPVLRNRYREWLAGILNGSPGHGCVGIFRKLSDRSVYV